MKKKENVNMDTIKPEVYITQEDELWDERIPQKETYSQEVIETGINYVKQHDDLSFLPPNKTLIINLCLSNDEQIHKLNKEFRKMDKATNVLSFANIDDENFAQECQLFEEIELGDIIIARETLEREAQEKGISFKNHYSHLLVHGILHLLGFDHQDDDEAEYMEDFERKILNILKIDDPYKD